MSIKVKLNKKQVADLKDSGTKGKVIEEIAKQVLFDCGAKAIYDNTNLDMQINKGDLVVITPKEKSIVVEVKSSHTFKKTNIDKLAFDYKYFKKYSNCKVPYDQGTTKTHLGWIYYTQADWVMSYNKDSSKMYVIKNYQKMKFKILDDIEKYIETLENGIKSWYSRCFNNNINKYLEGGVNKCDTSKDSLIVNLELSEKSIENFGGKCVIFDIEIEEQLEIDRKKPSYDLVVEEGV